MKPHLLLFFIALLALGLTSCDPNRLYEVNSPLDGEKWAYSDIKSFSVEVADTSIRYNIYINIRHSFHYEWRNIYVLVGTLLPDGRKLDKRVDLPLSEPDGKWFGSCLGDNCDLPVMIQQNAKFPMPGKYTFSLRQDMRVNPLDKVKAVGLRVERAARVKNAN